MRRSAAVAILVALCALAGFLVLSRPSGTTAPAGVPAAASVILIPGYGGQPEPLQPLRDALTAAGYDVAVLDIGDGSGDLRGYAASAADLAQTLLADGAASVSSIGFSAGGLVGRIAATDDPELFRYVISLAAPHEGTVWARFGGADCEACRQMVPGSELLESLPDAPDAQAWLSLYSATDEVIAPAGSSALPGATVATIQQVCTGAAVRHGQVPAHAWVIEASLAFLGAADLPTACPLQP